MRRTFAYVSFVPGVVLIALSPLLRWYSYPRVAKAPTDVYDRSVNVGRGSYFSPATLSLVRDRPLRNVSIAKGDPAASTHDVAVVRFITHTYDPYTGTDIAYTQDVYAMDRITGYALHCCGEYPRHEGLTLKFPFDTQKRTYLLYDVTALKAFPATYVRTEVVEGLKCYVFVSEVPQTGIGGLGLPGVLAGQPDTPSVATNRYYSATTTLWVEPFTGAIIKVKQHVRQWLTYSTGAPLLTLVDATFQSSQAHNEDTARQVRTKFSQLQLLRNTLPIYAPAGGVILVAVGLVLLFRPSRRSQRGSTRSGAAPMGPSV